MEQNPLDVVRDSDMTGAEKRSRSRHGHPTHCAIGSNPALRETASGSIVSYDNVIDALQSLDRERSPDTMMYTFKRRQRRTRWTKWKDGSSSGRK